LESAYNYLIETSSSSSSVLCTDVANCIFPSQGSSFVDKYQNLYNVQPLFTSTPEQFENSNWDPNYGQTESLQDVTIDTILFALPITKLGTVVKGGEKVVLENANYAQTTYRNTFSIDGAGIYTNLAGKPINTIDDLAIAIKNNVVKVEDIPVEYIVRDGKTLILNTRTSQALEKAEIPRSQWKAVDKTGDIEAEIRLNTQLQRNNLDSDGVSTVRQTGGKSQ
jgi:hypothetical protein